MLAWCQQGHMINSHSLQPVRGLCRCMASHYGPVVHAGSMHVPMARNLMQHSSCSKLMLQQLVGIMPSSCLMPLPSLCRSIAIP